MRAQRTHYSRAFLCAIAVHILALLLVVFNLQFETLYKPSASHKEVMQAVVVDRSVLEKELDRSRAAGRQKKLEQQRRETEKEREHAEKAQKQREADEKARLEKEKQQASVLEKQVEEEKRLAEQERKREQEKKRLEEERKRVAQQAKQEEKKKRQEIQQREQEKKRLEEIKRKQEEQQRRENEERKRQQEEQKRQQEEARKKALLSELAAEEVEQQQQADAERVNDAIARISDKLARYFNKAGLPPGLVCRVRVRTVLSGDVVSAQVVESSGNTMFDRQCEIATQKASPLPVPVEQRLFETYFREVDIRFNPWE
ncbi:MAG: cell envelope integrity protein TolA [Gammaproteobacteria bacterium]